jgi:hypothetical protein
VPSFEFDSHANLAYSLITGAPTPALTGQTLVIQTTQVELFSEPPFNCGVWPPAQNATVDNCEFVRVTETNGTTFTILREQEGSSAQEIGYGWQIAQIITKKSLEDIEGAIIDGTQPKQTVIDVGYSPIITPVLPGEANVIFNVGPLSGSPTLELPLGEPVDGQMVQYTFQQDSVGGRFINYVNGYQFGVDVTEVMDPTTPDAKWRRLFIYSAAQGMYQALAIARGF